MFGNKLFSLRWAPLRNTESLQLCSAWPERIEAAVEFGGGWRPSMLGVPCASLQVLLFEGGLHARYLAHGILLVRREPAFVVRTEVYNPPVRKLAPLPRFVVWRVMRAS